MINKPFTHAQVVKVLDKVFSPDISVKLDSESNITGLKSLTIQGANFLLKHNILGLNYDFSTVLGESGLCFEVID